MAAAAAVLGGMVGFVTALLGMLLFSMSPLQALELWSGAGILTALTLIGYGLASQQAARASWFARRGPQTNLP